MARTVGDRLAATRRGFLLGREGELDALNRFLDDEWRVLAYLHGPGGVGKTSLVDALATDAARAGRPVVWVDGADLEPTVAGLRQVLHDRTGSPDAIGLAPQTVLVIDRFDLLGQLAGWFWRSFLPELPDDVHVVIAGRSPPPETWRSDPAFAELSLVLPVRNLSPDGAAELVRRRGVTDEAEVAALVRATHGHPLAIVIATDFGGATPSGTTARGVLLDHPDAAARLLGRFVDEAVSSLQRDALHVCGHARRVDRAMLRDVLGLDVESADELLAWLRERPYAESHADGLSLHDVVKEALDRDLRWRDQEAFQQLHLRIRTVVVDRMQRAQGRDHDRWAGDLLYLHRGNPDAGSLYAYEDLRSVVSRPLNPADPEELAWLERVCASERPVAWTRSWVREQPEGCSVFEDALGRRTGACFVGRLDLVGPGLLEEDRLAAAMLEEVGRIRPPEPGEVVLTQWVPVDGDDPHQVLVVSDQAAATALRAWQVRGLGWVVLGTSNEERWAPMWTYIGFERLASRTLDGRDYAIWARDFARSPFSDWLAALAAAELDETGTAPRPVAAPVALSRADFGDAVRRLLKDLHDPRRVRRSPLLGSRLAVPGPDPADALIEHLRKAVACLAEDSRMLTAARAIDRTFLRPAGSQEKAAEVLGLSFSTYRRHLAAGLSHLEALLWDWELHGVPASEQEVSRDPVWMVST